MVRGQTTGLDMVPRPGVLVERAAALSSVSRRSRSNEAPSFTNL
jgi:hypothetical protein